MNSELKIKYLNRLPNNMSKKLLKLGKLAKYNNYEELILNAIVLAYEELTIYKEHKLIKYYEDGGQQYYEHYKEGFKARKNVLISRFKEVKFFLECNCKMLSLLSENEIIELKKNIDLKIKIDNPNNIIKQLEQTLTLCNTDLKKEILYIVTGLKRLTKKDKLEQTIHLPIPKINILT